MGVGVRDQGKRSHFLEKEGRIGARAKKRGKRQKRSVCANRGGKKEKKMGTEKVGGPPVFFNAKKKKKTAQRRMRDQRKKLNRPADAKGKRKKNWEKLRIQVTLKATQKCGSNIL